MLTTHERPSAVAPSVLDALVYPEETAACLAVAVPQALLVEALDELRPSVLSADGRIDALVAVERHIGMLQARSAELLAAIDAGDSTADGWARESVAAALRVPPASMKTRMSVASDLALRLPATLELLRAGEISQRHAFDLADATRALPVESVSVVEARVLERAPEQTAAQFRASVKRAVLRVSNPAVEAAAHLAAVAECRVILTPVADGMAELWALLPAPDAAQVMAALNARAQETIHAIGGDDRTADQRRADALVELADTALADPALTRSHGQRPAIQVTIAASTLMGLDDQPAELDGYGPITAVMARRIATDPTATWRRILTDDHGQVLHASSKTYRPTADMISTVIARNQHCTFPGCRRHARYNDLDHVQAFREGDETTTANLQSLCRRHHRLKHHGTWHVDRDDTTGITTWTDRCDRTYRSHPPARPTTSTVSTTPEATTSNIKATDRLPPDPPPFGARRSGLPGVDHRSPVQCRPTVPVRMALQPVSTTHDIDHPWHRPPMASTRHNATTPDSGAAAYSPVAPSMSSRTTSRWPT